MRMVSQQPGRQARFIAHAEGRVAAIGCVARKHARSLDKLPAPVHSLGDPLSVEREFELSR